MKNKKLGTIKVVMGETSRYEQSVLYFKQMGASHFYIIKGSFKGVNGDLMLAFKNVIDADDFLPEAKRWGVVQDNSLRIVSEEAERIENHRTSLN